MPVGLTMLYTHPLLPRNQESTLADAVKVVFACAVKTDGHVLDLGLTFHEESVDWTRERGQADVFDIWQTPEQTLFVLVKEVEAK